MTYRYDVKVEANGQPLTIFHAHDMKNANERAQQCKQYPGARSVTVIDTETGKIMMHLTC